MRLSLSGASRRVFFSAFFALLLGAGCSGAPAPKLHYQKFAIAALLVKNALDIPTRVEVTGFVVYKHHEADGDIHLWICDTKTPPPAELKPGRKHRSDCVVAEAMPDLPGPLAAVAKVKIGDEVTADGITRWDGEHQWLEAAHPIEKVEVLK